MPPLTSKNSEQSSVPKKTTEKPPGHENEEFQDVMAKKVLKKRKRKPHLENHPKSFNHAAQWHYRTRSIYKHIGLSCHAAWAIEGGFDDDPILENMSEAEQKWHIDTFSKLLCHAPGLREKFAEVMADEDVLGNFIIYISCSPYILLFCRTGNTILA
ncbi:hypothetical protein VKT23_013056 [Stygiomarasmius scandens]|uniref:Uncharacterized protein n=1 Tax=Marasmiellus scandens TaxID=2682957 RepID=A0ABR1J518_9AGAR